VSDHAWVGSFVLRRASTGLGSGRQRLLERFAWGDHRRRAEEQLRDVQARYRGLVEQLPLVTYVESIDPRESTAYVSPQIEALLGYGARELERRPELLRHVVHEEDRPFVLEQARRSRSSGEPRTRSRHLHRTATSSRGAPRGRPAI
jgi:PAS domain S-box-containing protein